MIRPPWISRSTMRSLLGRDRAALCTRGDAGTRAGSRQATPMRQREDGHIPPLPSPRGERRFLWHDDAMSPEPERHPLDAEAKGLVHPWPEPPAGGATIQVAPGIQWIRMPLP